MRVDNPAVLASIEAAGKEPDGRWYNCGCQQLRRSETWHLCQYHQGFNDAYNAETDDLRIARMKRGAVVLDDVTWLIAQVHQLRSKSAVTAGILQSLIDVNAFELVDDGQLLALNDAYAINLTDAEYAYMAAAASGAVSERPTQ